MKSFFLVFVFFFSFITFSQNIRLEGIVTDSTGTGIEMANVVAINKATQAMTAYAITNDQGKYFLNVKAHTTYHFKVSYIGYTPFENELTTDSENSTYNIILSQGILLNELEIVHEMPVTISGDTIVYNTDSFTTGTERKLEDVLKKLPGVEINDGGEVQVEGKTVKKVMVEGKDFFDGDTKLATQNIPADALDKVQVLRNYNEVSNLKGLENNEENIALNIKLKEGKKNFWFGDVTAGIGVGHKEGHYIANPKLFYYSPKYSINFIGNINNIGELPLTMRDYFKFTGGFRNMMRKGGSSFNVSSNDLGIMGLRNDKAANIDTQFGAASFSYSPSKAWTISGFGIFSGNKTNTITNSVNDLPDGSTNAQETRSDISEQQSHLGLFKLSSSYVPSEKVHFDYDTFMKFSNQKETQTITSSEAGSIITQKDQKPFSINQNLNYYYTLNEKHVLAFETQYLYQEEDPFYKANLENLPFATILPDYINETGMRDDVSQERFIKTSKFDTKLDYYYMLTPKSNLNFTLGNTYSYQNFNSHIFQILGNGSTHNLTSSINNNDVNYVFNDAFWGVHYKVMLGDFIFTPGFSVHQYHTKDEQLDSENKQKFNRFLPDFYAKWQIKKSETLTYNYALTNSFTDIVKLSEGYVFSNYSSLYAGNRYLENALVQTHSLRYFRFNMFHMENIFANVNYTKQTNAVKSRALLSGINQVSTSVNMNSDFADETFSANGNYGRSFLKYYKALGGLSLNWSKFNNIRVYNTEETIQSTESFTQSYHAKISTNFKEIPNIGIKYTYSINDNSSDIFYTDNPSIDLEYYFLDAFSFVSEYNFYHNQNKAKSINTEYNFLSASLSYQKKDSKWEWKLSGTNLLNSKALNSSSFNQLGGTSSFSSYIVQPRYIILSLQYSL
ncbi:MAG: carboxypeptidase regulatory-like domain-containing protein [Aestuariibaculum sp.]